MTKRKKQSGHNVLTRTRQTPAERILAQRARRAEVYNQEEDGHHGQQLRSSPVQQPQGIASCHPDLQFQLNPPSRTIFSCSAGTGCGLATTC
jgi:hypothetical protein